MQKFKTMSKLKLKTVQNGTEVENPNLMESGSYDYVDCSGYVIIGSGVYDNSGNLVEDGWMEVSSGYEIVVTNGLPSFQIEVTWDSGNIDIPIPHIMGSNGLEPCVPVTFNLLTCLEYPVEGEVSDVSIVVHWINPFTALLRVPCNIVTPDETTPVYDLFAYFTLPYEYHFPPLT